MDGLACAPVTIPWRVVEIPEGKEPSPVCVCISLLYIVSSLKLEMVSFHLCERASPPCIKFRDGHLDCVSGVVGEQESDTFKKPEVANNF